jgi:hypothetical protein
MSGSGAFRFLDDTDAQRQLGVDRITFEALISAQRLRPVSRQGTIQFFRATDIAKLRDALNAEAANAAAQQAAQAAELGASAKKPKQHDPAMRVHLRLQADLKWYDISDHDLQAWFDQLHPDTWERRRAVAQFVKARMEQITALIDAGAARLADQQRGGDGGNDNG